MRHEHTVELSIEEVERMIDTADFKQEAGLDPGEPIYVKFMEIKTTNRHTIESGQEVTRQKRSLVLTVSHTPPVVINGVRE